MKAFQKIMLSQVLLFFVLLSYGQVGKNTGAQAFSSGYYLLGKTKAPIKFTKTYSKTEDAYTTTYKIYDATGKKLKFTVIANHSEMLKEVIVTVSDNAITDNDPQITNSIFFYENSSVEPFGRQHPYKKGAYEARVKFTNSKFQYLKVMEVMGDIIKDESLFLEEK